MNNKHSLLLALSLMAGAAQADGYTMDHVKTAQKATAVLSSIALPLAMKEETQGLAQGLDTLQQCLSRATESEVLLQKLVNIAGTTGKEGMQAYGSIRQLKARPLQRRAYAAPASSSSYAATSSSYDDDDFGYAPAPAYLPTKKDEAQDRYIQERNNILLKATSKILAATIEEAANTLVCMKLVNKFDNRAHRRIVRAAAVAANKTIITAADQLICKELMNKTDNMNAFEKLKTHTGKYFVDLAYSLAKNAAMQAMYEVIGELILRSAGDAGTISWLSQEKEKIGIVAQPVVDTTPIEEVLSPADAADVEELST